VGGKAEAGRFSEGGEKIGAHYYPERKGEPKLEKKLLTEDQRTRKNTGGAKTGAKGLIRKKKKKKQQRKLNMARKKRCSVL